MAVTKLVHLAVFGALFRLGSGGSCYKNYVGGAATCLTSSHINEDIDRDECCMYAHAEGYSKWARSAEARQSCESCKHARKESEVLREKVFCFLSIYYDMEGSCLGMDAKMQDPIEWCRSKYGTKYENRTGFYSTKEIINQTVPTYRCKFCKTEVGPISGWAEWSGCSVSCGGGIMTREPICPTTYCYNAEKQTKPCNQDGECDRLSASTIAVICLSILLVILLIGIGIRCAIVKRRNRSGHPSLDRTLTATPGSARKTGTDWASAALRYHNSPARPTNTPPPTTPRPRLPEIRSPASDDFNDHTYESLVEDDDYVDPIPKQDTYLAMK